MRNFQEKKRLKNILESRLVLIFLFIVLVFFAWGVIRLIAKLRETSKNRENAFLKVAELKKTKEHLSAEIGNLKTDKGLEENIREKFGLAKEGEGLIVVVDDKNPADGDETQKQNWLERLFNNWFK